MNIKNLALLMAVVGAPAVWAADFTMTPNTCYIEGRQSATAMVCVNKDGVAQPMQAVSVTSAQEISALTFTVDGVTKADEAYGNYVLKNGDATLEFTVHPVAANGEMPIIKVFGGHGGGGFGGHGGVFFPHPGGGFGGHGGPGFGGGGFGGGHFGHHGGYGGGYYGGGYGGGYYGGYGYAAPLCGYYPYPPCGGGYGYDDGYGDGY